MSAVKLLAQAIKRICEEAGEPWPEGTDAEFDDPNVVRLADVFAKLVIAEHARAQRPSVVHVPAEDTEGGAL